MEVVLIAGLVLGLTSNFHCIGMCGPIALAVPVSRKNNWTILRDAFVYNFGRILTYAILGFIIGSVGISIHTLGIMQWISIIAGILLVVFAWRKYLSRLLPTVHLDMGLTMVISRSIGRLMRSQSPLKLPLLGMLNGILPCGMVYVALGNAMLGGSMLNGALAMLAFGVGTLPGMLFVTFMANRISPALRQKMTRSVPYILTIVGFLIIARGLNLGIPYISPKVSMVETLNSDGEKSGENATMSCCKSKKSCD
jgi:sulfite exporter TauE/SafE